MGRRQDRPTNLHYHIRWHPSFSLDWQAFSTREEAEECAKDLVRSNENYTIEATTGECKRCKQSREQALRQHEAS